MTIRNLFLLCMLLGSYTISFSQQFETEGIIHSSNGGIMFPDKSLQKTAAHNLSSALAGDFRGIGFLQIDGYPNHMDTAGLTNIIPIIDFELMCEPSDPLNPRSSNATFQNARATFNIGPWSPTIWRDHATGKKFLSIDVHLTTPAFPLNPFYFEYNFEVAQIVAVKDEMVHLGNSQFAHLQTIEFIFDEITWTDKSGSAPISTSYDLKAGN